MRFTIANTHSGTGKTTTALGLAGVLARQGKRVLIVDLDPIFGVTATLGLNPKSGLHHWLFRARRLADCVVGARENVDIVCPEPNTAMIESKLRTEFGPEFIFELAIQGATNTYDAEIFDAGPGFSLLQMAALCYTQKLLVPVTIDPLGLQGGCSAIAAAKALESTCSRGVDVIGIVPVMIRAAHDIKAERWKRDVATFACGKEVPLLTSVVYDESITFAARDRQFLVDHDIAALCSGLRCYRELAEALQLHL